MRTPRAEEQWVASMVAAATGVAVTQYDDGTSDGMYDLHVGTEPQGAMEVVAAADPEAIEFWNLMNGDHTRWIEPELQGGWMVTVSPAARVKRLKQKLPLLLQMLEQRSKRQLWVGDQSVPGVTPLARVLGVTHASQGGTDYPGSIYVTVELGHERTGGMVPDTGEPVRSWLEEFLKSPACMDVRRKLAASGLSDRHVFVLLPGFNTAPFPVAHLLMQADPPRPSGVPSLPSEITHVWAASTWTSGHGFRWSPSAGWTLFEKGAPAGE